MPAPAHRTSGGRGDPSEELILGVDEAGRGSLLGPLVVAGFRMRRSDLPLLLDLGVKDSKLLSPSRREATYGRLLRVGTMASVSLSPSTVDASVRRTELNLLEARTFAGIVRRLHPDAAFVDACDPVAARFGRLVSRLAGSTCRVDARHHADRDLPIVGAASIVAKVRRDRAMAKLRHHFGESIGSGYPSDERTREFVRETLRSSEPLPTWLRHSWKTLENLKPTSATRTLESFRP